MKSFTTINSLHAHRRSEHKITVLYRIVLATAYFCPAWNAIHASFSAPNTAFASIRCSTVAFDAFNCITKTVSTESHRNQLAAETPTLSGCTLPTAFTYARFTCAALTTSWRPLTRAPSRTASHSTASRLHSRARMFPSFPPRHASTRASTVSFSAARAASSASAAAFAACSAATAFDGPAGVTVLGAAARGVGRGFAAGFACV